MRDRLVLGFRLAPGLAVYSPRKDVLVSVAEQGPIDGLILMAKVGHALDKLRCERLLSWARARALGVSTASWCSEKGWSRVSLYNASDDVAVWLNARSCGSRPILTDARELVS